MQTLNIGKYFSPLAGVSLAGLVLALLAPAPARASIIVTVGNATVAAGGSGSIDVILQNTGGALTVDSFGFLFTTTNTNISFSQTNILTLADPYIFAGAGNSVLGPIISALSEPNPQTMNASDVWGGAGSGASVGTTSVALGHVLFTVASGASGTASLVLTPAGTSLTDGSFNAITINTENPGTITITASSGVPEPSTIVPLALLLLAGVLLRRRSALGC